LIRLRSGRSGFDSWQEQRNPVFSETSIQVLGANPISYSVDAGRSFPDSEDDTLFPTRVDAENEWSCTSAPQQPSWNVQGELHFILSHF